MDTRTQAEREIGRAFRELSKALSKHEHPELANAFRDAADELDPNQSTCTHEQLLTVFESTGPLLRKRGMDVEYTECMRCGLRRYPNEVET